MTIKVIKPRILHNEFHPEHEEKDVVEPTTKTSEDVHGGDEITQSMEDQRFAQQQNENQTQSEQQQNNNTQQQNQQNNETQQQNQNASSQPDDKQTEQQNNNNQQSEQQNESQSNSGNQQNDQQTEQQQNDQSQSNNDSGQNQQTTEQQHNNTQQTNESQQNDQSQTNQQQNKKQNNNNQQNETNQQNNKTQSEQQQTNESQQTTEQQNKTEDNNETNQQQQNDQSQSNNTQLNDKQSQNNNDQQTNDSNAQTDQQQNETEEQTLDDSVSDDYQEQEVEEQEHDYDEEQDDYYEDDEDQEDTTQYNTQQAFKINEKRSIKRQLYLTFYRLVEYLSDEEKQPTLLPGPTLVLNVKKLMMRQYERKPINAYYYFRTRSQVVLILDNSGSMTWLLDELNTFFKATLKRKDVIIYVAPNGHIEEYYNDKTKRFEEISHEDAIQQIIKSSLPVVYIGDFDGANTPIELSWTNRVYWICPETRYKYFSHHDWVGRCLKVDSHGDCKDFQPYYEDDFKGFFGRAFDDKEMITVLKEFAKNVYKQRFWYDKHDIEDFSAENR